MINLKTSLFSFLITFLITSTNAALTFNVLSFGAKGNGKTDSTQAFLKAWSYACNARTSAVLYVPRGSFLIKPLVFRGPCRSKIVVRISGTIVAPWDYWSMGSTGYWVLFERVNRLHIAGGTFDARGAQYWNCRKTGKNCPSATRSISFFGCNNVVVSGLTSINSHWFHMVIDHCNNIAIRNTKIYAPKLSPNTDGIHIQSSVGVTIFKANIQTGDDCISIGQGSRNVWIEGIACGPGHGISIGSLGASSSEAPVYNVTVTSSIFTGTDNGVRIKTWARPSNIYARNINFRNLIMKNVYNPVIIDQNYCPGNVGCNPTKNSGVQISGVRFSNIRGTSTSQVALNLVCSARKPCQGVLLENINLSFVKGRAKSYCKYVVGRRRGVVMPQGCF